MNTRIRPPKIPEPGFYYHYKHDPTGPINEYAYEIQGVHMHTEDDCRRGERFWLIYRPLYEGARVRKMGLAGDARPLWMFWKKAKKNGKTFSRFQKITDPELLANLVVIRDRMYPVK